MHDKKEEKYGEMKKIHDEIVAFKKSPLYKYRVGQKNLPVIGEGSHDAKIMFVGEAPGKNEALTGLPFCGQAGRVLDELLASIGVERKNVYITNIVKDRPPENRDPFPEEITAYAQFLDRQIEIIQPKVVVPLGRFSMKYILEKFGVINMDTISKVHGLIFGVKTPYGKIKIMPMYHPAASLYNPNTRKFLEADFKKLKDIL